MVSFGILNHVFTIDQETARQIMKEKQTFPFNEPTEKVAPFRTGLHKLTLI
jgi:hypothetical protein